MLKVNSFLPSEESGIFLKNRPSSYFECLCRVALILQVVKKPRSKRGQGWIIVQESIPQSVHCFFLLIPLLVIRKKHLYIISYELMGRFRSTGRTKVNEEGISVREKDKEWPKKA